ncbi:MAG: flagellar basal body rod protein FlgC [Oligoflexales bacterium]
MSFFRSMNVSSSALAAQRLRMNVLSSNLANANTTRGTEDGGPYRRRDVVFSAVPASGDFDSFLDEDYGTQLKKVKVVDIHKDTRAPRRVHDPSHPDADENGFVNMPNIQVMSEMVNMIMATRAYEANATALDAAKQMAARSIEIGR